MAGKIFGKTIEIMAELGRTTGFERRFVSPPDLLAVAVAIDNSIAELKEYPIFIETTGEYTRGMTVVDRRRFTHLEVDTNRKKVAVALSADQEKYAALILNTWLNN
jgi:inosine-uridine nucleoside N-ribohydrolase